VCFANIWTLVITLSATDPFRTHTLSVRAFKEGRVRSKNLPKSPLFFVAPIRGRKIPEKRVISICKSVRYGTLRTFVATNPVLFTYRLGGIIYRMAKPEIYAPTPCPPHWRYGAAAAGLAMTQDRPTAARTARLRMKFHEGDTEVLMALSGALRPFEKQSKDFSYGSRR